MARARGSTDQGASRGPRRSNKAIAALRASRLGPQARALKLALRPFGNDEGAFDLELWRHSFESPAESDIAAVITVAGIFQALINNYVALLRAGARQVELPVMRNPNPVTPRVVEAIRDDGGLSGPKAEAVIRLYRLRNRLQHASTDVQADEVHEGVLTLLKMLPGLVRDYVAWMQAHGLAASRPNLSAPTSPPQPLL